MKMKPFSAKEAAAIQRAVMREAAKQPAAPDLSPATREMLAFLKPLPDKEALEILETLTPDELHLVYLEMAPEECDCLRVPLACECGATYGQYCHECDTEPDYKPCPHFKRYYLSWPVLVRLCELIDPDPPLDPRPSIDDIAAENQEDRAVVMARRYDKGLKKGFKKGYSLWHPKDRINESRTSEINDRMRLWAYTLSGYKRAGCPNVLASPPPANGDVVTAEKVDIQFFG